MTTLTRDRLQPLLRTRAGTCVSIYLPTHRHHPGTEQDPIRFKNALKEAERLLSDRHSPQEIRALLDPVAARATASFWRHQGDGLAFLRSRDQLEEFRLPLRVPELVVVAESFHVRPLIRSLHANARYFLIALSQNGVDVFEGSATSLHRVEVPGLPGSIAEFEAARRGRKPVSAHRVGGGGGNRRVPADLL